MGKLVVLMVVAFVDTVGLGMILPILPFLARDLGANALTVGALFSAFSVAQLLSAPLWGRLSDQRGRRPAIITGLLISAVGYVVFAYAGTVGVLMFSRVVAGLGGGTIGVVQAYVADASRAEDRAKTLGWLTAVTSFGWTIGPAAGALLDQMGGHRAPGFASMGLCLLVSAFAWRYLVESHEIRSSRASLAAVQAPPRTGLEAIWGVISRPAEPSTRLIWVYALAIGAFYGTGPVMPLLLADRIGMTEKTWGYFIMYVAGMGVLIRTAILGRMVDWLGEARLSRVGMISLATGLSLLAVASNYPVLMTSLTLMPLGTAFIFPCVTGLLSRVVQSNERGLYMGVQQTFGGLSRVAFPVGVGLLMDHGGRAAPFWVAGTLVLLTLTLTTQMDGYAKPRAAPAPAD